MLRLGLVAVLFAVTHVHCGAMDTEELAAAEPDLFAAGEAADGMPEVVRPPGAARTFLLTLKEGAFPPTTSHPSALVYLPAGYDPTPPVSLLVYIHGFSNCVENIVRNAEDARPCTPGGPVRNASSLIRQMEASGKNAILLCPEVAFDQRSGDPGKLGTANGFRTLLGEVLQKLREPLRGLELTGIGKVALASHSGGYVAAAAIASRGGVPVDELYLLDSLYGNSADFESWIRADLPGLSGAAPRRRFAAVYTDTGGTLANSQALARRAADFVPDASVLVDDRTTATWPLSTYRHGLLFKRSMLSHDGVTRYYFQTLLATSGLKGFPVAVAASSVTAPDAR